MWGGVLEVLRPPETTNVESFLNSLFFLSGGPIPYFGLDPFDPRTSFIEKLGLHSIWTSLVFYSYLRTFAFILLIV